MKFQLSVAGPDGFEAHVVDDCSTLDEACELFKRLLMAAGYAGEFKDTIEVCVPSDLYET